ITFDIDDLAVADGDQLTAADGAIRADARDLFDRGNLEPPRLRLSGAQVRAQIQETAEGDAARRRSAKELAAAQTGGARHGWDPRRLVVAGLMPVSTISTIDCMNLSDDCCRGVNMLESAPDNPLAERRPAMSNPSRRDFLAQSAVAVGALGALAQNGSSLAAAPPVRKLKTGADEVTLGKTGIKSSL